ncbi:hypothetical protein [Streptomyces indicus]|uniref:hypothetical protein n=1 Tax=Streptomyces indicus TaxID=417292 RepID=UPI00115F7D1F|nr:hypothetical protein [Streptomyces indicus]
MTDFVVPLAIAVIGLVATGLGAVVGARAARFGAEKNAEAVRRQVQDQGAVEHGHWMRQERLSTYESFLEAWDECLRLSQGSADADSTDAAALEPLRLAAGRMEERARRIALLGPQDVTYAAESLAKSMGEDVAIAIRFVEAMRAATTEVEGNPVPVDAVPEATAEYERRHRDLADLVAAYREQGRDLRELDGHPVLRAAMESIQRYRQASGEAMEALNANYERLFAASEQAFAMVEELQRNREERELSRERFTRAARTALSAPPLVSSTETTTETTEPRRVRLRRRRHPQA